MCEIFPEVKKCCFVVPLPLGCLYIAVLTIMTGVISLSTVERTTNCTYVDAMNVTDVTSPAKALKNTFLIVTVGGSGVSLAFIITGFILIFAITTVQEGFIQIYVWITFIAILVGICLVGVVSMDCLINTKCILEGMDFLTGSIVLIGMFSFFILMFYFICVANSLIVSGM